MKLSNRIIQKTVSDIVDESLFTPSSELIEKNTLIIHFALSMAVISS